MTENELRRFLQDNLSVEVSVDKEDDMYHNEYLRVNVKLYLKPTYGAPAKSSLTICEDSNAVLISNSYGS